ERRLRDGGVEVFSQPDGTSTGSRRVFLTDIVDPQGLTLHFTYDASLRLVAATDAIGQVTTLSYELAADSFKVTKVTDPFGRAAVFTYNAVGQLARITDVIGLTSSFSYGARDFVAAMTTPYGTTTFDRQLSLTNAEYLRFVQATDPAGGTERAEFRWVTTAVPASAPANEVPTGFEAYNQTMALDHSNTFYWDKRAMALGGADNLATVTHWRIGTLAPTSSHFFAAAVPHSVKRPLEHRVWYAYPGQTPSGAGSVGTWVEPSKVARTLDDGSS